MKTNIIEILESRIAAELTLIDPEARFNDMLDECYSFESVGGPFAHMSPSRVLKECDPVAYRCGVNDYADGEEWVEVGDSYYDQGDVEKIKDALMEELEGVESDLEEAAENYDESEEEDRDKEVDREKLGERLAEVRTDLETLRKHSF